MPLNIDWQQIFFFFFNFTILFAILYFLLYKPVKAFMEKRRLEYENREKESQNQLTEAENIKAQYQKKLEKADEEIQAQKQAAEIQLRELAESKLKDTRAEVEKLLSQAKVQAQKEHDEIVASAQQEIADSAVKAAEKMIAESTSQTFDQFLASVERSKSHDNNH